MPDRDAAIDGLYDLPLDEFTPARDRLARELRDAGDRDAAAEVKSLRKPSVAAWALNRARRRDAGSGDELLEAGKRLRTGQEQLLAGEGRQALDSAAEEERRLVAALARAAEAELEAAGRPASGAVREKLRSTLHAVAMDDEAREAFDAGRLVRDHEASGLGMPAGGAAPPRSSKKTAKRKAAEAEAARERKARERHVRKLEERLERARRRAKQARGEAARAARELEGAELTVREIEAELEELGG